MISKGFLPLTTRPTRVSQNSATLIDNIFSTSKTASNSGVILDDMSDHYPIFITDNIKISTDVPKNKNTYQINKETTETLKNLLSSTNWENVTNDYNHVTASDNFFNILNSATELSFPIKMVKPKKLKEMPIG